MLCGYLACSFFPPMRHRLDDNIAEAMPEITGRERKTGGGDG